MSARLVRHVHRTPSLRIATRVLLAGFAVQMVAVAWQLRWHALNPGAEALPELLRGHSGIYAGVALSLVGALWSPRRLARAFRAGNRSYALAALGTLGQLGGMAWDIASHARAAAPGLAHDVYAVSTFVALAGLVALAPAAWARGPRGPQVAET